MGVYNDARRERWVEVRRWLIKFIVAVLIGAAVGVFFWWRGLDVMTIAVVATVGFLVSGTLLLGREWERDWHIKRKL